jgi:Protein of unknown function (DUF2281)
MVNINEAYQQLTPEHQREVDDFVEFLKTREGNIQNRNFGKKSSPELTSSRWQFAWEGALEGSVREKTGVDLQHEALEIRIGKYKCL